MRYRQLGASDLSVSVISLGSWLTFGVGIERERAIACVRRALALGINLIDTANVYGRGAAESLLGEALAGVPRDSYVLATKVFGDMGPNDRGLSRAQIEKQLDASLKRLKVDFVDLYQCHRYDADTPFEETMAALTAAVKAGKTRYVGFSEWSPQNITDAFALNDVARFVSSQPQYSLLWRRPEKAVIPLCAANGVSQIVWSPLAQGVLTGKYAPGEASPGGIARSERLHGRADARLAAAGGAGRRRTAEAHRRRGGGQPGAVLAGLGAARAQRRLGHRRRQPSRTARRERRRRRSRRRSGVVCPR